MSDKAQDLELIIRLNRLWEQVYPYLARWIKQEINPGTGRVLELGPFAGGITRALAASASGGRFFIAQWQPELAAHIQYFFGSAMPGEGLRQVVAHPLHLPFRSSFDLIIFRGAFFFLTPPMLREIDRALPKGGTALVGGGYGPLTPQSLINKIAAESRELNYRLGKKWLSPAQLPDMVSQAGLHGEYRVLQKGGLWLMWEKR